MPHSYIFRMVAMEFQRPVSEHPLPIDPEVKVKLSPDELQRLTRAKSSVFKFERFADLLSPEEMDEKAEEEERRNQVCRADFISLTTRTMAVPCNHDRCVFYC